MLTSSKVINSSFPERFVTGTTRKLVMRHGKGNRAQVSRELSETEEDKLFEEDEFSEHNPVALQRTLWWLLALSKAMMKKIRLVSFLRFEIIFPYLSFHLLRVSKIFTFPNLLPHSFGYFE